MCVVAVKYFKNIGWVGAKNRDRSYLADVEITQSNRDDIQRLYIDDKLSRYTEGLNESGISIISASLSVKSDEKEGDKAANQDRYKKTNYMSPDGKKIRDALKIKDPLKAAKYLIKNELAGMTYIFNQNECWLVEGGFTEKKEDVKDRDYIHKLIKIKDQSVRTNHGIELPQLGYKVDSKDPSFAKARKSSEERLRVAIQSVKKVADPLEMIDALAVSPNSDPFMNPIRHGDPKKKEMVTTGQLLLVPADRTLHYRPIYSSVSFTYNKLNGPEAKTFFEIVSSRKLLGFKEYKK